MKFFETNTDFSFAMEISKSFAEVETTDGDTSSQKMFIKGVASNTRRDKQDHRFTRVGLEAIKTAIEEGIYDDDGDWTQVPLRSGHRNEWDDVLGYVTKAEIDDDENLWITAELDQDNSTAQTLYRKISKGNAKGRKPKLGFSVRGQVTKWHPVFDPEIQKNVPHFDNLLIKEISVTQQPANPTPYPIAIAKSLLNDPENAQALEENMPDTNDTVLHPAQAENNTELKNIEGEAAAEQNNNAAEQANLELQDANTEKVIEETTVDSPEAPQEPQRVSETVAEDSDANDVPEGYAAAPKVESEAQEAQTQEVTTDPAADPVKSIESGLASVVAAVQKLQADVEAMKAPVEAQKSEESVEPANPVTVADDLDEKISLAVSKAFETFGLKAIVDEMQVVKSTMNEVLEAPAGQHISVSKAKDAEDENDPMTKFNRLKDEGQDPLSAALAAGYIRKK